MKHFKLFYIGLLLTLILPYQLFAQAPPQKINYQAVARDASGIPMMTTGLTVVFDIRQGSASGTVVYSETHTPTTNQFGLFTSAIGGGAPNAPFTLASFAGITWGSSTYFLQVTVNGDVMPSTQLLSVPYALHAGTATSGTPGVDGLNCWDLNGNGAQDAAEDINNDGSWNALDCKGDSGLTGLNGLGINWLGPLAIAPAGNANDAYYNSVDGVSYVYNGTTLAWDTLAAGGSGGADTDWIQGSGVVYNSTDLVGIGTTTPVHNLTVFSTDTVVASFSGNNPDGTAIVVNTLNPAAMVGMMLTSGTDSAIIALDPSSKQFFMSNAMAGGHTIVYADSTSAMYGINTASVASNLIFNSSPRIYNETDTIYSYSSSGNVLNVNQGSFYTDSLYLFGNNMNSAGFVLTNDGAGQAQWQPSAGGSLWQSNTPDVYLDSGNVGIGTAAPIGPLHLLSDQNVSGPVPMITVERYDWAYDWDGADIQFKRARGFVGSPAIIQSGDEIGALTARPYDGAQFINRAEISFNAVGAINTNSVPTEIVFKTSDGPTMVDRMVINSGGNVGIGTSTPADLLHIESQVAAQNAILQLSAGTLIGPNTGLHMGNSISSSADIVYEPGTSDDLIIRNNVAGAGFADIKFQTAGANDRMVITEDGLVGIGMTSPSSTLDISSTSFSLLRLTTTAANSNVNIDLNPTGAGGGTQFRMSGGLGGYTFLTSSSIQPRLSINDNGNIGIGATTAQQLLTLSTLASTTLRMERSTAGFFDWEMNVDNLGFHLKGGADGTGGALTDFVNVDGNGKMGLGITTPTQLLHLYNGTLRIDDGANPYNLPASDGTISGQVMTTDAAGTVSWATPASGSLWQSNAPDIYFGTGNVGIGTSTPESKFHVALPNGAATNAIQFGHGNQPTLEWYFDVDPISTFSIKNEGNGTPITTMSFNPTTGYVGIGTTTPNHPLQVSTSANSVFATSIESFGIQASGLQVMTAFDASSYSLKLEIDGNDFFKVMNNMTVGIGLGGASPSETLHLDGTLRLDNIGGTNANGNVLTTDGTGVATWEPISGDGNGIYTGSGSLSGATTVTQGANSLTFDATGPAGFNIDNNVAGNLVFTIMNITDGSPSFTAGSIGARIGVSAGGAQTATGIESKVTGTTSNNKIGGWFSAEGTGAGWNRGLNAYAANSTGSNLGVDVTSNSNTGTNYGMRVNLGGTGTGSKYGLHVSSAGTTAGSVYGLYLQNNGTGTKYGIYSFGEDRNYFSGDVGVGVVTPSAKLHIENGDVLVNKGHLRSGGATPGYSGGGGLTGNDIAGSFVIDIGASETITFSTPYATAPSVIITPADTQAAGSQYFVNVTPAGFEVFAPFGTGSGTFYYQVIEY